MTELQEKGSSVALTADGTPLPDGAGALPTRSGGRFVKGQSGNPLGRPAGAKNRANIVKHFIEEKLTQELAKDAIAILKKAIEMAKNGDRPMIKLLIGDMLADARKQGEEEGTKGARQVVVVIQPYNSPVIPSEPVIDVEVTEK